MICFKKYSSCLLFFILITLVAQSKVAQSKDNELLQCEYDPVYAKNSHSQINWRRNDTIYLSPYLLLKQTADKKKVLTLIDVRTKKKFNEFHIDDSINLPFTSLKARSIFKSKKIVLIGTGSDYKALEFFREQLVSSGFNRVFILDGGINFWKSKIKLRQLKYEDYYLENITKLINGDNSRWIIVDVSNNLQISRLFSNVQSVTSEKLLYKPASMLKLNTSNKALIENILLVLPENTNIKEIVNIWQTKLKANVYVIKAQKLSIAINQYDNKRKLMSQKKRTDGARLSCMQ